MLWWNSWFELRPLVQVYVINHAVSANRACKLIKSREEKTQKAAVTCLWATAVNYLFSCWRDYQQTEEEEESWSTLTVNRVESRIVEGQTREMLCRLCRFPLFSNWIDIMRGVMTVSRLPASVLVWIMNNLPFIWDIHWFDRQQKIKNKYFF